MKRQFNIATRIWLSVCVFAVGYIFTTVLGQFLGVSAESELRYAVGSLLPAAERTHEAEAAFQRAVKGFSDSVMTQDAAMLRQATQEGRSALVSLREAAGMNGLEPARAEAVRAVAANLDGYLQEANSIYGTVVGNPESMTPEMQARMGALAARTNRLEAALRETKQPFTKQLEQRLSDLDARSVQQRYTTLICFIVTLMLATAIVHFTIQRGITRPITRIVRGVQEATGQTSRASDQMLHSGQIVARDAQEQAACIEETSASLEQISASTRQNASLASEANQLMGKANRTVEQAAVSMKELTASMDEIHCSGKKVSQVLKNIDEIAFQTNILALNAAVEAVRAGQAGAGFSVVADEVRSLAQRAAEAAKNSAEIIDQTLRHVAESAALVSAASEAFGHVSANVSEGSEAVARIAVSSEEQAKGIDHIGKAISRIETVTQSNALNAQQTADGASGLAQQVQVTRAHLDQLLGVIGLRTA